MNFDCPHCDQNLEIDDSWAGESLDCPTCHKTLTVPDPADPASESSESPALPGETATPLAPAPPMYEPLQPVAPPRGPTKKKRKAPILFELLLIFLVLVGGSFSYAMYRWHTSPQQTLHHLTILAEKLFEPAAAPTPTPVAELPPATPSVRRPDPIAWLIEHHEAWPKEVILREPIQFPAVSHGKVVGSLTVPAGAVVKVIELTLTEISADFMGGTQRIPISATDLAARAEVAMNRSQLEPKQGAGPVTQAAPSALPQASEEPAQFREATVEQISRGLGAMYTRQGTTFRLFSPAAKTISVVLYDDFSGNEGRTVRPLRQQSNNLWDTTVRGDLRGKFYSYLLDEKDPKRAREILDPYATNSVASSSRGRITPMTASVPSGPRLDSPADAVIYEMHVRDFTIAPSSGVKNSGLYLGFTEQGTRLPDDQSIQTALDHLSELGITHVELMPVQDFENDESSGSYNWGYITSGFFSPEGMFATNPNDGSRVRELKALVTALHARKISVIMDVVYNHTSGKCSLMSIAPEYYYRRAPNGSLANGSGCGNEFKSESPNGRRLILDSLKFWAKEYGIDGFRFDLMALIDQETIRQAERELRAINPSIILFGEPWTGGNSPLANKCDKTAIRQIPAGAFNDDFRNALKGSPDGDDRGWIEDGSKRDALKAAMLVSDWIGSPAQSINYMTCHDNLVLVDKLAAAMPNAGEQLRIEAMKLGYLGLFTAQGVPFFHGGEEFARSKGGNNNSYEAPDSVNEVDWNLKRQHSDLFNYVRDLIALRKAHPMFRLRTTSDVRSRLQFLDPADRKALMFTINGEGVPGERWKRICVVLNSADGNDIDVILPGGEWAVALDASGAEASSQIVSGKLTVRHKSGMVLYQK